MGVYDELGIRPIINACATLTRLGGSRMPPEVLAAMAEAARSFVDLPELQRKVGEQIAALTHNEAAYVSSGAAAGLVLATAACITGENATAIAQLPDLTGLKNEVIVHNTHRNGYDHAVRQVGVRMIEIGAGGKTTSEELEQAITPQTAAIVYFLGVMTREGDVPLDDVIAMAKMHGVPVIVDAAAQLPPVSNLWDFTQRGVDMVVFSGGKDLRGPQCSGLILGRKELIRACALNANPNHSIGRPMKVGKEEMVGLLAAVRRYLSLDHAAREWYCEQAVADWNAALNAIPGVSARRDFPNEACQPVAWCLVTINPEIAGIARKAVLTQLENGDPIIAVAPCSDNSFHINPMTLEPGEEKIVLARLLEAFPG